jgi:GNAT superfamily N-acetyltransferase
MPDMLVKLYTLPDAALILAALAAAGIQVRRANAWEKRFLADWVRQRFGDVWAAGCEVALEQHPVTCFIAVEAIGGQPSDERPADRLLGFACYDVAGRGIFGPTGVQEDYRRRGIGTGLLLACLHAMYAEGYAYAIIGQAGPVDFYAMTVGATVIEGSETGTARRPLRSTDQRL